MGMKKEFTTLSYDKATKSKITAHYYKEKLTMKVSVWKKSGMWLDTITKEIWTFLQQLSCLLTWF